MNNGSTANTISLPTSVSMLTRPRIQARRGTVAGADLREEVMVCLRDREQRCMAAALPKLIDTPGEASVMRIVSSRRGNLLEPPGRGIRLSGVQIQLRQRAERGDLGWLPFPCRQQRVSALH